MKTLVKVVAALIVLYLAGMILLALIPTLHS